MVAAREAFIAAQPDLAVGGLVFLDEAGVSVAESRRYGWLHGAGLRSSSAQRRRLNLIGAIALDGVRALRQVDGYVDGYVDGDEFLAFLREDLGPCLNKGDIVILDGPTIHKVAGVTEALAEHGATAMYLPAYSPDLNPIEMTWAWIKKLVRGVPTRTLRLLKNRVDKYWGQVTTELCVGWLSHSGYSKST